MISLYCLSTMVEFCTGHGGNMTQLRYCPFLEFWQIKLILHIHIQNHKPVCLHNNIITHFVSKLQLLSGHILSRSFQNPIVFFLCCTRKTFLYTLVKPHLCHGVQEKQWQHTELLIWEKTPFPYPIFYCFLPALKAIWGNRPQKTFRRKKAKVFKYANGIWHGIKPVRSGVRGTVPVQLINYSAWDIPVLLSILVATILENIMSPHIFTGSITMYLLPEMKILMSEILKNYWLLLWN